MIRSSRIEHDLFPKTGSHFSGSCSSAPHRRLVAGELREAVVSVHQKRLTQRKLSLGIDVSDITSELTDFAVLSAGHENEFARRDSSHHITFDLEPFR